MSDAMFDTNQRLNIVSGIVLGNTSEAFRQYKKLGVEERLTICESLLNETVRRMTGLRALEVGRDKMIHE